MAFHVEVNFSAFPFVAGFGQEGADQAQESRFIGEHTGDASAAFEFHIDPFEWIAGAQAALMGGGKGENREALGQVLFHPCGQLGSGFGLGGHHFFEPGLGAEAIRTVKDRADRLGHGSALIPARHISLGVLLEVKLAALPGHTRKDRLARRGQSLVLIADEELRGVQAALLQAGQEGPPVDFGFAQRDANAQNGPFAVGADAQGNEDSAINDLAAMADFFVAGIQKDIAAGFEGTLAPAFQFGVELGGALADLGGTDGMAAELLDNGRDFAGGDALDIHFGQG